MVLFKRMRFWYFELGNCSMNFRTFGFHQTDFMLCRYRVRMIPTFYWQINYLQHSWMIATTIEIHVVIYLFCKHRIHMHKCTAYCTLHALLNYNNFHWFVISKNRVCERKKRQQFPEYDYKRKKQNERNENDMFRAVHLN